MAKEIVQWSVYQEKVFEAVCDGKENILVSARAGSGKTKTLCEAINRLSKQRSPSNRMNILCVAFNKSIAVELSERISKSYVDVSTIHSLGLRTLRHHIQKVQISPDKTRHIIQEIHPKINFEDLYLLERASGLCKNLMVDTPSKIDEVVDTYAIDPVELSREEFIKTITKIMRVSKERSNIVDYIDMIWLPTVLVLTPPTTYSHCLIDEIQDLTKLQLTVALSACNKQTKVICFGDPNQVLYGFNSVSIDSVEQVKKRLTAQQLSLPISYRCPKSVISLAKEFATDILAAPHSIEGSIHNIVSSQLMDYATNGCFILSRTNAPLIKFCMQFLRNKRPANIAGKDIGESLLYLIKKSNKKTLDTFLTWLEAWKKSETQRCFDKKRSSAWVLDKYECLVQLAEDAKNLEEVKDNIKALFQDISDEDKVVFSTVHKAKGLERENVFLLNWTFKPDKNQEEANIKYVAITRSKNRLYFVEK